MEFGFRIFGELMLLFIQFIAARRVINKITIRFTALCVDVVHLTMVNNDHYIHMHTYMF